VELDKLLPERTFFVTYVAGILWLSILLLSITSPKELRALPDAVKIAAQSEVRRRSRQ
jgi:hypothetical protein